MRRHPGGRRGRPVVDAPGGRRPRVLRRRRGRGRRCPRRSSPPRPPGRARGRRRARRAGPACARPSPRPSSGRRGSTSASTRPARGCSRPSRPALEAAVPGLARPQDDAPGGGRAAPAPEVAYELVGRAGAARSGASSPRRVRVDGRPMGRGRRARPSRPPSRRPPRRPSRALAGGRRVLSRLTLRGFKSFADPTTLELGPGRQRRRRARTARARATSPRPSSGRSASSARGACAPAAWPTSSTRAAPRRPAAPVAEVGLVLSSGEAADARARPRSRRRAA